MKFRRQTANKKLELVSANEACKLAQEFFQSSIPVYSTKTIYNKVAAKELRRYGPRHMLQLDKEEVLQKLCKHHGA